MADYIEGKRPIIEALRTQVPIKRILLADNAKRDGLVEDILRKAKHFDVTVTTVPRKTLDDKSERGSHQGVMAETKPHAPTASALRAMAPRLPASVRWSRMTTSARPPFPSA